MNENQQDIIITPQQVLLNGQPLPTTLTGEALLTELYKRFVGDYPKFYKMDTLCRLGFIGSELLLQAEKNERFLVKNDRMIIFANKSASIKNDTDYLRTIQADSYYPSPALFVYTLPNIVTGEIAIRNNYRAESSFYVLQDEQTLQKLAQTTLQSVQTARSALVGWVECESKDNFYAHIKIVWKN